MSRRPHRVLAVALAVLAFAGCESTRSFFQMSSDSPVPFFGVDMELPPKFLRGQSEPLHDGPFDAR